MEIIDKTECQVQVVWFISYQGVINNTTLKVAAHHVTVFWSSSLSLKYFEFSHKTIFVYTAAVILMNDGKPKEKGWFDFINHISSNILKGRDVGTLILITIYSVCLKLAFKKSDATHPT